MSLNDYRDICHDLAKQKGWHDEERTFGDYIALMHSELSEALEAYRDGMLYNVVEFTIKHDEHAKPEGIPIELVDVLIRIFDFAGMYGIDLESAFHQKNGYNMTRPHRHGGKAL